MRPRALEQGIDLSCACEDMKMVQADPDRFEEVLTNLITNAINYSPDGGLVAVTAKGLVNTSRLRFRIQGWGLRRRSFQDL